MHDLCKKRKPRTVWESVQTLEKVWEEAALTMVKAKDFPRRPKVLVFKLILQRLGGKHAES